MSKEERRVPEVRFEGFYDDWKQRKLTNLVSVIKSYPLSRSVETEKNTGVRYIHYGDIHTKRADKITSKSNIPNINVGDYKYLEKGDLALADASEDYQGIAMPSVIVEKTPFRIVAGLHTIALRPKTIEPLYLYYLIHSSTFRKYGYKVGTGMKVFGISKNNILKFETLFPCIEEQTKISSLLNKIDDTIALHQRKLDKLQELKKAALQSLFPQKEETEPKVRFANFSSPWKQRKFSDLLDPKKGIRRGPFGSALKKDLFVPESNYVVYEQQNAIYDRYNTRYNITEKKFKELSKFEIIPGDFIMSGAGTIGRISRVPKGIKKGVFNQALIRFKVNAKKIDSEYFLQLMRSDNMQRELTRSNPGSAMINLVPMSEVKKWKIKVPGFEEQREIGQFFSKLDNIVTLYQQKLEKQQNLKKAFLQKMFI